MRSALKAMLDAIDWYIPRSHFVQDGGDVAEIECLEAEFLGAPLTSGDVFESMKEAFAWDEASP